MVPLRELVYRVIDLPPSMRPLVYDFGQLNTDTARDYTTQIVRGHVSSCNVYYAITDITLYYIQVKKHTVLSQDIAAIIPAIARVLAWSQKYMREREVYTVYCTKLYVPFFVYKENFFVNNLHLLAVG